jgi:hypothetical protein
VKGRTSSHLPNQLVEALAVDLLADQAHAGLGRLLVATIIMSEKGLDITSKLSERL